MPPLNLDLLIAGDHAEWDKAWNDHGFHSLALRIVEAVLGKRRPSGEGNPFVEDVAQQALIELLDAVTNHRVNKVEGLKGLLRKIATDRAIDLLRRQWFNKEQHHSAPQGEAESDWNPDDIEAFLRSQRSQEGIGVDRPIEKVVEEWADAAQLDFIERALFREHLVHRSTLEEFGETHELHPSTVFRLKREVVAKLKRLFRQNR